MVLVVAVVVLMVLKCSDPSVLESVDVGAVVEVDDAGKKSNIVGCV